MERTVFSCFPFKPDFPPAFYNDLAARYELWSAAVDTDGVTRLKQVDTSPQSSPAGRPVIPLKKLLLPPEETVWTWTDQGFQAAVPPPPRALIDVAPCDLQALWYLDQVFADDQSYRTKRQQLLLIGAPCRPTENCRCQPDGLPLAADLFQTGHHIWALTSLGRDVLKNLAEWLGSPEMRPLPKPESASRGRIDDVLFNRSGDAAIWQQKSMNCLACGSCSAVCPTCYCYDMVDHTSLSGESNRQRVWDNCFFSTHGKVAGGHDFRPTRASRLRFRFEHKLLGFGALRGRPSCVGCGRCREACPAGIDLDQIAEQLNAGEFRK